VASIKPTKVDANGRPARGTHWRVFYRDPHRKLRSQTFARKVDAEAFADRAGADMQRGEWIDPAMRRTLFEHWADEWWETTIKLAPSTRRGYHQILRSYVLPYFSGRRLASIDYMDVERFIATELRAGLGPKKVRDAVSVVSLIMRCAVRANARKDNPAAGHDIEVRRRKVRAGDILDMADLHRLVEHVRDPYKPAIWLLVLTGMRPAELCGLRVRSIDFPRRTVRVTETLTPVNSFGDQHRYALVDGPPKTEAGDRDVPIPSWLCDDLAAMLATRAAESGRPCRPNDYLFLQPKGGPLNRDKFRQSVVRPALRDAGLPETVRTYDVRHSHASLLIDLGANPLAVAQRMGHSDPTVTLRVYGHLFEGVQEQLTEQLDDLRRQTIPSGDERSVVPLVNTRRGVPKMGSRATKMQQRDADATP
jgi:integrase